MTYDEIIAKLKDQRLEYLENVLLRAVMEEAEALRKIEDRKLTQKYLHESEERAKTLYAEDISAWYNANGQLEPDHALNSRRAAIAWAIARKLLDANQRGCPVCGKPMAQTTPEQHGDRYLVCDRQNNVYFHTFYFQCSNGHEMYLRGEQLASA